MKLESGKLWKKCCNEGAKCKHVLPPSRMRTISPLSADFFELYGEEYILVADHYTKFLEVRFM